MPGADVNEHFALTQRRPWVIEGMAVSIVMQIRL
ncbi:hypothetical protein C8R31_101506 [Nitrosospira sp. Nsp2]|nr:hypothetical protein C8R31_101506 [Nitrosospira sp. Nsp2]